MRRGEVIVRDGKLAGEARFGRLPAARGRRGGAAAAAFAPDMDPARNFGAKLYAASAAVDRGWLRHSCSPCRKLVRRDSAEIELTEV